MIEVDKKVEIHSQGSNPNHNPRSYDKNPIIIEYNNIWYLLTIMFCFIGIFLGAGIYMIAENWEKYLGILLSLGSCYKIINLMIFKSIKLYENIIVLNSSLFNELIIKVENIVVIRHKGTFGGGLVLTDQNNKSFRRGIIIELSLLSVEEIKDLKIYLIKMKLLTAKSKLDDLIK